MKTKIMLMAGVTTAAALFGAGAASAQPDVEAIVNSTCTYPQVMNALRATSPETAAELESSMLATGWIQNLLAAGPDERRASIAQLQAYPQLNGYASTINAVAYSCQNY
ncbi:hemophore-related protein [[Mycobacterium] wendilense]|uniref:Hemophore-related protein n=1 Tax=[Mycobacterium] wendilense TaxID=3064284 RepID=A0ABN9P278_9MYCO|nr:hemophore-related protein [Mycolicibacterium sp. MU0050]CAJ1582823.1 hemophore-related protein [Mycolicibacterium sp. MU0050]